MIASIPKATQVGEMPAVLAKKKFEYNLEGLRGLASLVVVWYHAIYLQSSVDPGYNPSGLFAYYPSGHLSVLVFFVLSGYVIGITNKTPMTWKGVGPYLKKRFVRIYPIYGVAMLLTLVVAAPHPLSAWLANLSLTQVLLAPVVAENAPAWSLHYEILYYLLFIPLSMWRINAWWTALICLVLGTVNLLLWPGNTLFTSYAYGFTFWVAGLGLARNPLLAWHFSYQFLASTMLLFLSMTKFNIFETILLKIARLATGERLIYAQGIDQFRSAISLADLAFLPFGITCILVFTNKKLPFHRYALGVLFGLPAITFFYLAWSHKQIDLTSYVIPSIFYVAAVASAYFPSARVEVWAARLMARLVQLGSISYALYIVHFPIIAGLKRIRFFSGTSLTYGVRFAVLIILSLLLASLLEKKFQPLVRRFLDPYKPRAVPN